MAGHLRNTFGHRDVLPGIVLRCLQRCAMAVFSTVLPIFLLSYAIHRIGSVSALYLADVILGERISLPQIAGSSLVLPGVLGISPNSRTPGGWRA
ncbi:MAG: DMT family transporter [Thiobacillus sp.]